MCNEVFNRSFRPVTGYPYDCNYFGRRKSRSPRVIRVICFMCQNKFKAKDIELPTAHIPHLDCSFRYFSK